MEISETFRILYSLIQDIARSPNGLSSAEVVEKYGIAPRTFTKYRDILEDAGIPLHAEKKRWYVMEGFQVPFTLLPVESEVLALALDYYRYQDIGSWKITSDLLKKLEPKFSNQLGDYLFERFDRVYPQGGSEQIFRQLVESKHTHHEIWVDYQALKRDQPMRYVVHPLAFVRNPYGDGTYLVGYGIKGKQEHNLLTLKLGRILAVGQTGARFEPQVPNHLVEVLNQAWGVWHQYDHYEQVELLFDGIHQRRLDESRFHFSQEMQTQPDGRILFRVQVSHWKEMVPWIRGWGAGVEVIHPIALRQYIIADLVRQSQRYQLSSGAPIQQAIEVTWAKYDKKTAQHHLLIYHLLDVAAVARLMWEKILSNSQKQWLCDVLGMSSTDTQNFIALLIGWHDIGKASADFQRKVPHLFQQLMSLGWRDDPIVLGKPHGIYSRNTLLHVLQDRFKLTYSTARAIASGIGGHHGEWIAHRDKPTQPAEGNWRTLQEDLIERMVALMPIETQPNPADEILNVLVVFLSGMTSVCDWIGSSEDYFPYCSWLQDTSAYWESSLEQAHYALSDLGWYGWRASQSQATFESMFGFAPNALQRSINQYLKELSSLPDLVLIESSTGGGKTEAALYLADRYLNEGGLAGMYVAMPTQATSNQMFGRVANFLGARYPDQSINIQLIHSQAMNHPLYKMLQNHDETDRVGNENGLVAESWFQHRKRTLLSSMAVGTVDQAMLGVLQTRHHFVRQFALSHKVIIFDEVHAYDTYMSTIINRLCQWLKAMSSPTIMLSATLPNQTKRALLQSFGANTDALPSVPYPRMTCVKNGEVEVLPLATIESRQIHIHYLGSTLDELVNAVEPIYQQGGCIAIICNTVNESIAVAQSFTSHTEIASEDVWLFHARFPPIWRKEIEQNILSRFGKTGQRPTRAIVVATQIIEQSLDLDFDLLISSVAPIDLLIQRIGRLHRHDRVRPEQCALPTLWIRQPAFHVDDVPQFGVDEYVYHPLILLRTWAVIRHLNNITLPDNIDRLIESIYSVETLSDLASSYVSALQKAQDNYQSTTQKNQYRGKIGQIDSPDNENLVGQSGWDLSDDLDDVTVAVATRDIMPGIDLICLHQLGGHISLDNHYDLRLDLAHYPTSEEQQALNQNRVTIRSRKVQEILQGELFIPESWKRSRVLRSAYPIIFHQGEYRSSDGRLRLTLTRQYGLEISTTTGDDNDTIL